MNHYLRSLASTQQVALLFFAIFGLLTVASVAAFLMPCAALPATSSGTWR